MKKFIFTFVLGFTLLFSQSFAQTNPDPFDSFLDGAGDIGQSIDDYFEGVGEDVTTDLFGNTGIGPIPDGEFRLPCPEEFNIIGQNTSARGFILNILNFFLSFLGLIAVSMLIYAGFLYLTDAGEGGNQEKAKKTILYSVVGILLVLASFAIVNTVIQNAGSGGNDTETGVTVSGGFTSSQNLVKQCGEDGNGIFQQTVLKWKEFSGDGFITDYGNGLLVKNGEAVNYTVEIASEIVNSSGEAEAITVKSVLWNFGNGFVSYEGEHFSETNTYFQDGKNLVGVIVLDTKNRKYMLTKKVLIGDGVQVRFSASNFFPKSGTKVSLDGSSSSTLVGSIQGYEWTTNRVSEESSGSCPDISASRPKTSAEFYKNDASDEDLVCEVTLTITTNIPGVSGTKTEEIIVSDGQKSPKPIVNTILVEQDSEEEHLFKVKAWVDDKIDHPLENFRFEVWDSGKMLKTQSTTFGVDPSTISTSGSNPPSEGFKQTYSEILLDLSAFGGTRDLIFRVIATNSYGNQGQKDTQKKEYSIPETEGISQEILDFTLPATLNSGEKYTPILLPDDLLDPEIYTFSWFINGNEESTEKNPELSFTTTGMQTVELRVGIQSGMKATFTPVYGWKVLKKTYIKTAKDGALSSESLDFSLPAQIALESTYTPTLSPNELLDPEVYDFKWEIDGFEIATEKNPEILFSNKGLNTVTLIVSVKSGQIPTFTPVNGWKLSKNIFVGEDDPSAPYKRLDFSMSSPLGIGSTYSPFVSPNTLLDPEIYDFEWQINGAFESEEKEPTLLFETPGINTIVFRVSLKEGKAKTFTPVDGWTVTKTTFIQNTQNRPPIIYNIPVSPGNTGDTSTVFSFYPLVSDPDGDALTYKWDFGDGVEMNAKNVAHRFQKNGTYSATLSVSDGLATTEEFVNFTIVSVGEKIPESTIDVYVRDDESNLDSGDIGIQNKDSIKNDVTELHEKEKQMEAFVEEQEAEKKRLENELKNTSDPERKEAIRIQLFQIDEAIKDAREILEKTQEKREELETLLEGEYIIEGTTGTLFFLYGTVPIESSRAILLEWESGDGESFLGQNITLQYKKPGIYTVKMIVSDGQNTVFETIGIKVTKKSPQVSKE